MASELPLWHKLPGSSEETADKNQILGMVNYAALCRGLLSYFGFCNIKGVKRSPFG
jgi:hypothetical protein